MAAVSKVTPEALAAAAKRVEDARTWYEEKEAAERAATREKWSAEKALSEAQRDFNLTLGQFNSQDPTAKYSRGENVDVRNVPTTRRVGFPVETSPPSRE